MTTIERDENLIALSGEFHSHQRYGAFYERFANELNGITGIYDLIRSMGIILTDWEEQQATPWESYDWLALTEYFANRVIKAGLDAGSSPRDTAVLQTCFQKALLAARFELV